MSPYDHWNLIENVIKVKKRVLLYGKPGTGKTYAGLSFGLKEGQRVYNITLTEDMTVSKLEGIFRPTKQRTLEWMDGPAIAAYRNGHRLVINEIDLASGDVLTFLYAILDDEESATLSLMGETIKRHNDFSCVATMNGHPEDLPEALKDRFEVKIEVLMPHPAAIQALSKDLQAWAESVTSAINDDTYVSLREIKSFDSLRTAIGVEQAAKLVWPKNWRSIIRSIEHSAA